MFLSWIESTIKLTPSFKFCISTEVERPLLIINGMYKSIYFSLEELLSSDIAVNHGYLNIPSWEEFYNLRALATEVLDVIRQSWGEPIIVTSGYRCPEVNTLAGGVLMSAHMSGLAADIRPTRKSKNRIHELFDLIRSLAADGLIKVDQVILYETKGFIHVSNDSRCRNQFLIK